MSATRPHRINLSRRWRRLDRDPPIPPDGSTRWIDLDELSPADVSGEAMPLVRSFNRPTRLTAASAVHLVLQDVPVGTACCLNDQPLGTVEESLCRFDIARQLQPNNRITLKFRDHDPASGLGFEMGRTAGQVWLELV